MICMYCFQQQHHVAMEKAFSKRVVLGSFSFVIRNTFYTMQEQIRYLFLVCEGVPCVSVPASPAGPPPRTFPDQGSVTGQGQRAEGTGSGGW